jgi:carbonic anhydrase
MLDRLRKGVREFQNKVAPQKAELFERLAEGQTPDTLFVTCSDSRIDPHLITQSRPGDLFIVRNPGNMISPYPSHDLSCAAAVEFAVSFLKVKQIVLCGHSDCGAIRALLEPEMAKGLKAVSAWLADLKYDPIDLLGDDGTQSEPRSDAAVRRNICIQWENLLTHPCVQEAFDRRELEIDVWFYEIATGRVEVGQELEAGATIWEPI